MTFFQLKRFIVSVEKLSDVKMFHLNARQSLIQAHEFTMSLYLQFRGDYPRDYHKIS